MRRTILWATVAAALSACAGCETDYYAREFIQPTAPSVGLLDIVTGTGDQLVQQKRIDLHRVFTMVDGTPIDVWVVKAAAEHRLAAATAILLHGLTESKARYLGSAQDLAKRGYDVVLIDLRAHGRSGGRYVTYGELEKKDVKAVMDALIKEDLVAKDIYVFGATLGAATAIQYAAIDGRVKGVVALTPYRDAASMGRLAIWGRSMSDKQLEDVLNRAGEIARFNPHAVSSETAASQLTCPLLLVHAFLDLSVPVEHSQAIFAAARGPKELIVVSPGPEQLGLALTLDKWVADRLDYVARTGLRKGPEEAPAPPPASAPATAASTQPAGAR